MNLIDKDFYGWMSMARKWIQMGLVDWSVCAGVWCLLQHNTIWPLIFTRVRHKGSRTILQWVFCRCLLLSLKWEWKRARGSSPTIEPTPCGKYFIRARAAALCALDFYVCSEEKRQALPKYSFRLSCSISENNSHGAVSLLAYGILIRARLLSLS